MHLFIEVFLSILKSFILPIGAFMLFKNISLAGQPIGENFVFLGVTIAVTFSNAFSIVFKAIKIFPNLVLLRGHAVIHILLKILIEISSIIGFWLYYYTTYAK